MQRVCYKGLVRSRRHHVGLGCVRLTRWIFCVGLCAYVVTFLVTSFQHFFSFFELPVDGEIKMYMANSAKIKIYIYLHVIN